MNDTLDPNESALDDTSSEPAATPQGIGMAVAFDWGLAAQILVTPVVMQVLGRPSLLKQFSPLVATLLSTLLALPFATLLAFFGEGIRRGWKWTRPLQLGFNALLFLAGFASLYNLWQNSKQGNYWPAVTTVILLIFSPLIAWRMSRPTTARWFATVKSEDARKRHGGAWPFLIGIWAIIGGILQALAALNR